MSSAFLPLGKQIGNDHATAARIVSKHYVPILVSGLNSQLHFAIPTVTLSPMIESHAEALPSWEVHQRLPTSRPDSWNSERSVAGRLSHGTPTLRA